MFWICGWMNGRGAVLAQRGCHNFNFNFPGPPCSYFRYLNENIRCHGDQYSYTHTHTYIHTHIYIYTHTHTHTHTHIHIHTCHCMLLSI
jgi:hypothetical protein